MGLNGLDSSPEVPEKGIITLTLEPEKLNTPEGCLQEIMDIISFIKEKHQIQQAHLLKFVVNGQIIGIQAWSQHGFVKNEYNIPQLCMRIYKGLTPEQQQNFQIAFAKTEKIIIGTEPNENAESILQGIKYYLDREP